MVDALVGEFVLYRRRSGARAAIAVSLGSASGAVLYLSLRDIIW